MHLFVLWKQVATHAHTILNSPLFKVNLSIHCNPFLFLRVRYMDRFSDKKHYVIYISLCYIYIYTSYDRMYSHSQKKYNFVYDFYPGNVKKAGSAKIRIASYL